jgi:acetolactate synthase-1/2/3 large subunit
VITRIYEKTGGQAIVTTDVGQCQMWTAQFYTFTRPGQWVSSLGLGTMGFGLPAAIGARLADPKADVWVIAGDGSFQMTSEELAVAVIEKLPIRVAILNNGYLGMVRQWQELMYGKRYSGSDLRRGVSPDFVKLAQAYGAKGMRVTKAAEIGPTLDRAARVKGPVVIDFVVDPAANVMPMVRPGMAISEMYEG